MIQHQSSFHSIGMLCQVLDVSSSAFYAWTKNTPSIRQQENDVLSIAINKHFSDSPKTYGVPRIQRALRNEGQLHGKTTISRIMNKKDLYLKLLNALK